MKGTEVHILVAFLQVILLADTVEIILRVIAFHFGHQIRQDSPLDGVKGHFLTMLVPSVASWGVSKPKVLSVSWERLPVCFS